MENSLKGLIMAAGVIVTCVIVALGFRMMREATVLADTAVDEMQDTQRNMYETRFSQYDGLQVSGADVVNVIKKYLGTVDPGEIPEVTFSVVNGGTAHTLRDNSLLGGLQDPDSPLYVSVIDIYRGRVERDSNKVITGLIFTRK